MEISLLMMTRHLSLLLIQCRSLLLLLLNLISIVFFFFYFHLFLLLNSSCTNQSRNEQHGINTSIDLG